MNVKEMTIALNFKLPKKYQSAVILSPEKKMFLFFLSRDTGHYILSLPLLICPLLANHIRL